MTSASQISAPLDQAAFWSAFWALFHQYAEGGSIGAPPMVGENGRAKLNPGAALEFAAEIHDCGVNEILSRRRDPHLVVARALVTWGLRELGDGWSYPAIGRVIGGRDHSTIIALKRNANSLYANSPRFAGACEDLRALFEHSSQSRPQPQTEGE